MTKWPKKLDDGIKHLAASTPPGLGAQRQHLVQIIFKLANLKSMKIQYSDLKQFCVSYFID